MSPKGVYDRATAKPRGGRPVTDPNSLVGKLAACNALARKADKLEAKAKRLRKLADAAAVQAGEARDELAAKMRELMQA